MQREPNNPPALRLGIAGLGAGARQMMAALAGHPGVELAAAADVDREALGAFSRDFAGETHASVEEMSRGSSIDAVYIATPNRFHTEHTLIALRHGKHVLLEKPMALTLEEADTMIQAAESRGLQLVVSAPHSFEPPIRKITDIVRGEELGRLRMIHTWHFGDWLYRPRTAEELDPSPELGGGVVFRQGPHQFDILRTIGGGLVRSVRATTGAWDAKRPVTGGYTAFLEFEDGVPATAVYSGYDHFQTAELAFGSTQEDMPEYGQARKALKAAESPGAELARKRMWRQGHSPAGSISHRGALPSFPWISGGLTIVVCERGDIRLTPNGLIIYGEEDRQRLDLPTDDDGRDEVVRHFFDSVVHHRPPVHNGRWGKATVEISLAVNESAKQRREVFLSHQTKAQTFG